MTDAARALRRRRGFWLLTVMSVVVVTVGVVLDGTVLHGWLWLFGFAGMFWLLTALRIRRLL